MCYWKQLYLFFTLIFTVNTKGIATPILERVVTIKAQSLSLANVLDNISQQANFQFSYNPNIINTDKKVSLNAASETVRAVLKNLLGIQFQYKQKGNYLIIQKLKADEQIISGYVKDKKTGKNLENATIYDKESLASATTDSTGYYEIVTRKPIEQLTIARFNYSDTSFQVKSLKDTPQYLDVSLIPKLETPLKEEKGIKIKTDIDTLEASKDPFAEQTILSNLEIRQAIKRSVAELQRITERNITEDLLRKWQFSIAPYVSTNLALSGNVVNKFSLNATVGYSKGNRAIELGGVGNINQGKVTGLQAATLFNIVNGEMHGVQISTILNRTQSAQGLQLSGITNNSDRIRHGLQISGINNHTDIANGGVVQIAGIVNKTNLGRTALQIAGIINQADTVGVQIGLLNNANRLRGVQIGLINMADTSSGILLGILNIVKKGYHVLEVSTNDVSPFNIAYRTGTKRFYTIYAVGGQPKISGFKNDILSGGLGFGTSFWLGKTIGFTLDATAHRFSIDGAFDNRGGLVTLSPALNIQLTKKIGIALAPVWNSYYLNTKNQNSEDISRLKTHIIPQKAKASGDWMQWWGWSASLRFF
jgi:CarboxypepD_reg-like domain